MDQERFFDRERFAVSKSEAFEAYQFLTGRNLKPICYIGGSRQDLSRQDSGAWPEATLSHVVGEANNAFHILFKGGVGNKRTASSLAVDQALAYEHIKNLADGYAANLVLHDQFGFRRKPITWSPLTAGDAMEEYFVELLIVGQPAGAIDTIHRITSPIVIQQHGFL